MARVYGLKRATARMKWVHMNHVVEEKERLAEQQDAEAERKQVRAEVDAMGRCIDLEGARSFHRWWDTVPDFGPRRERIEMIEKRILNLKHEGSVANEEDDGEKSQ